MEQECLHSSSASSTGTSSGSGNSHYGDGDQSRLIDRLRIAGATVSSALDFFVASGSNGAVVQQANAADGVNRAYNLEIRQSTERSVIARRNIKRGEVLLSLPPGCYLSPPLETPPGSDNAPLALPHALSSRRLSAALEKLEPKPTAFLATALQLLHITCTAVDSSSWLVPYVRSLPSEYPHLPMCWSDSQLAELSGTAIDRCVVDRVERHRLGLRTPSKAVSQACMIGKPKRQSEKVHDVQAGCCHSRALLEAFDSYVRPLIAAHPELFPPSACTLLQFRACVCAVSSRSFSTKHCAANAELSPSRHRGGGVSAEVSGRDMSSEEGGRYMLPLVDMLNHCDVDGAATTLRFEPMRGNDVEGTFSMVAERDIPAGSVVEHSYGAVLTDAQLALSYGFCLLTAPRTLCRQQTGTCAAAAGAPARHPATYERERTKGAVGPLLRTYRCSVDLPLVLLRHAALSLGLIDAGAVRAREPVEELLELRRLALQHAGVGALCGQPSKSSTGTFQHGCDSKSLVAGILLESNWISRDLDDAYADDTTTEDTDGQEIVGRQIGGTAFLIAALILAMDTKEQLRQCIARSQTYVTTGVPSESKTHPTVSTDAEGLQSEDDDVLIILARLCAVSPPTSLDADMKRTVASATTRSPASGSFHATADLYHVPGPCGLPLPLATADRKRLGKTLSRLLVKTIELRDSLYATTYTLTEDEAALAALNGFARASSDHHGKDGSFSQAVESQETPKMITQTVTALAVRIGERRLLHAVKEFFIALQVESDDDEEQGSSDGDDCTSSHARETKRHRISASGYS